jgi:hypothetical protein
MPRKNQKSDPKDPGRTLARSEEELERATTVELVELLEEIGKKIRTAAVKKKG